MYTFRVLLRIGKMNQARLRLDVFADFCLHFLEIETLVKIRQTIFNGLFSQ